MRIILSLLKLVLAGSVMFVATVPILCYGQDTTFNHLLNDTWVLDSLVFERYPKDSGVKLNDSVYFQFREDEFALSGYPKMPSISEKVCFYGWNPIDGERRLFVRSCPDSYGILSGDHGDYDIIVVGEHWPYFARLKVLSAHTFMIRASFDEGWFGKKYYKRIETPEFLKGK